MEYLSGFCQWLENHTPHFSGNSIAKVSKLDEKGKEERSRRLYTEDEVQSLLDVAGEYRTASLAALYTELRRGELTVLEWRRLDLSGNQPSLAMEGQSTKNGQPARMILHPHLAEEFRKLKSDDASTDERVVSIKTFPSSDDQAEAEVVDTEPATEEAWTSGETQNSDLSCHELALVDQIDQTEGEEDKAQVSVTETVGHDLTQVDHPGRNTRMAALLGLELIPVI